MPAGREPLVLGALVSVALALRIALALVVAPFQAPDELAHLRYVDAVLATGRLPVQPPLPAPVWEQYYQPPLAYLAFQPLARVLAAWGAARPTVLRALRVQNALYGAATVAVGYWLAALLTPPGDVRRLIVAIVLALFPGFAASGSAVNNDALANLLAAALWVPLLRGAPRSHASIGAGLLLGAACLAKLSVLALAPLLLIAPLLTRRASLAGAIRWAAVAGVFGAAVLLPWAARNYRVYGDPLAIGVGSISFDALARVFPPHSVSALAHAAPGRAFVQFWGCFGIYNNLAWTPVPAVLVPLAALGAAGWLRPRAAEAPGALRQAAPAFATAVGLAIVALVVFSLRYWAAWQGRYLYTVMVPVAALLAVGWSAWVPRQRQLAFALALAAALLVVDGGLVVRLHRYFATVPPARWAFPGVL